MFVMSRTVGTEDFLSLICDDEELLMAEFNAIISAEWPTPAARERGEPCPRESSPGYGNETRGRTDRPLPRRGRWVRERSPPARGLAGDGCEIPRLERQVMTST